MLILPDLPYGYGDLRPVLSETTLRTHHGKHHARYVQVANELLAAKTRPATDLEDIVVEAHSEGDRKLFNNAAQAWNHGFFWQCMRRGGGGGPGAELASAIDADFGGLVELRKAFTAEGAAHFGSGWVWLVHKDGRLTVISTHDAATPVTEPAAIPLLVCDVWEHAYYLDHANDRAGFLDAWWDLLVNWDFADRQFAAATAGKAAWRYPRGSEAS